MAMDALKNLTNNIPDWLRRLDDLSGQVDKRQAELAAIAVTDKNAETRSMRNKGSTESLKPQDDGPSNIPDPMEVSSVTRIEETPEESNTPAQRPTTPPQPIQNPPAAAPTSPSTAALVRQTREAVLDAHARARQVPKKRQRPSSVISGDGIVPAYRTRSMIIVYYDSYVQGFFDDLVRFVSSSRNLVRKAKMAAKVAHIKKLAEMEAPEGGNNSDDGAGLPSLRYMSTRRLGPMAGSLSRPGASDQPPDIYDKLDKGLEFVQSTCEHGAHQFLRDADCNDEIKKIQKHLHDVIGMAETESERIQREEPELAKETGDLAKVRTRRPISMRRETGLSQKDGVASNEEPERLEAATVRPSIMGPKLEVDTSLGHKLEVDDSLGPKLEVDSSLGPRIEADTSMGPKLLADAPLEVDSGDDGDEAIDIARLPRLQYRSTRYMR